MKLTPLIKIARKMPLYEGCLHSHLTVSSQVNLMEQQVILPLLTPTKRHGTQSRQDEWSSEGLEYPSGLGDLHPLHSKAEYMTEATVTSKYLLRSSPGPYMTLYWWRIACHPWQEILCFSSRNIRISWPRIQKQKIILQSIISILFIF